MSLTKGLAIVLIGSVAFALLGAGFGAFLSVMTPDYYRIVFSHRGNSPDFNPIQLGVGLGLTQGMGTGIVLSLVAVVLLAWRDFRKTSTDTGESPALARRGPHSWASWMLWGYFSLISTVVFCGVGFVLGLFVGEMQFYQWWTERKLAKVEMILKSNDFPNVQPGYSSAAQVYLSGTVTSEELHTTLHDRLVRAFGTDEADTMMSGVTVSR